jgi:hypothetical protein
MARCGRPPLARKHRPASLSRLSGIAAAVAAPQMDPRLVKALPDAPGACTADLRERIAWGVGTSAYQVQGRGRGRVRGAGCLGAATEAASGCRGLRARLGSVVSLWGWPGCP